MSKKTLFAVFIFVFGFGSLVFSQYLITGKVRAQVGQVSQIINLNPTLPGASSTPPYNFYRVVDDDPLLGKTTCYVHMGNGIFCIR